MGYVLNKVNSFLKSGHERSIAARKNIIAMLFLKGISILVGLLLVPLTINYVDTETYGLWITISSVVTWMGFFDIGLNNGLRNRFAEAKAHGDTELAQSYVSTTYAMLSLIFLPLLFVLIFVNSFVNWNSVFNISEVSSSDLSLTMLIVTTYFCLKFILSTVNIILIADQRPANASLRALSENIAAVISIVLLMKFTKGSIVNLTLGLCVSSLLLNLFFNFSLFIGKYRKYAPSISKINFSLLPKLLNIGVKFFVIQIAMLVQFQTSSIIILRNFGGEDVTLYNVTYRLFNVLAMIFSIVMIPLWSSATEAYVRKDYNWINLSVKKYNKVLILFIILGFILLLLSPFIFNLWLGRGVVDTNYTISFFMLLYVFSLMIGKAEGSVLNGIGALKIQMYSAIISPFLFVSFIYIGIKWELGIYAVVIAGMLSNFNGFLLAPIQYKKIFKQESKNPIWLA
ncbi:MAG: oligosaccharide flippase family protein [Bacteroidales bacterium]|nr:oligosaccharide flippase family protein [Bacteroidales bacterium]MBN2750072.1 oligosaccharide flippase family protein [Bacteroidales bacterium]